jgi:hypothetical protein
MRLRSRGFGSVLAIALLSCGALAPAEIGEVVDVRTSVPGQAHRVGYKVVFDDSVLPKEQHAQLHELVNRTLPESHVEAVQVSTSQDGFPVVNWTVPALPAPVVVPELLVIGEMRLELVRFEVLP